MINDKDDQVTDTEAQQTANQAFVLSVTESRGEHHGKHHSHGHHRSRRGHGRRRGNSGNKFFSFLKKNRSILINVLSCTVSVVLLVVIAFNMDLFRSKKAEGDVFQTTQSTVKIETSVYPKKIPLAHNAVLYYMSESNTASANEVYKIFDGHKTELNKGLPLQFVYRVAGLPVGVEAKTAQLEISENDQYSNALTYQLSLEESAIDIYNLKTATKYYYRFKLTLSDGSDIGTVGSFETEASPRILNVDGAVNARDIGGWKTEDGQTVRQGLLFRGSEIDGAYEPGFKITDKGLQQMIAELGIRYDMDLRVKPQNADSVSILGKNVVHEYYSVGMYSEILNANNKENLRRIFSDLASPDNYPVYLHCTYGRDRTGSVCYLLEALLGVSDDDLKKDYELSALTDSYISMEFSAFVEKIASFEGNSTKEKVEGYLLSIGVTEEEISNIRSIFLAK